MGGHIHLPYVLPLRASYDDLAREVWTVQAGTALSRRVRGGIPNSVNLVVPEHAAPARACRLERWDYSAAQQRFLLHSAHRLTLEDAAPVGR
jgi:hypothetical protein